MIKIPATRIVAAVFLVCGVAIAPLLDNSDAIDSPISHPLPTPFPQFQVQRRQDELSLSGHTSSQAHEQALLQVAVALYPGNRVISDFQPLGIVPDDWTDTTEQVLYLLQDVSFAEAILSKNELKVQGVIVDEPGWQSQLENVRNTLPTDIAISIDTMLVDPRIDIASICDRAFAAFDAGPINFEESSTEFRNSAYPRLARLIALASACEDSKIQITGHTDASGPESWNRQLSRMRADAVGNYIADGGIERDRLLISGVGSAEPIADDRTRYGRSLNRRIEIVLSSND